jgi:hypothetical protein
MFFGGYQREIGESSVFNDPRFEIARDFSIAYGLTWILLRADPFNAAVFVCLCGTIHSYAKRFFDQHFSSPISWVLSAASGFLGAKVLGSACHLRLTTREAAGIWLIAQVGIHLFMLSYPMLRDSVKGRYF